MLGNRLRHLVAAIGATVLLGIGFAAKPVFTDDFIELHVPLRNGSSYRARDFYAEWNRKLGTHYSLDEIEDREHELSVLERAFLVLLGETRPELLRVRLEPDVLVLGIPDPQSPAAQQRERKRLERLLDVRAPNWPSDKGLHLPTPLRPDQPAVLLIHGINATAGGLEKLRRAFEVWGVQVLAFDYPDDGQLAASGERLRTELARLSTDHPTLKLVIVGHSMGGLVARYALEVSSPPPPCVTDLFMLGTPNQGSQLAVGQPWMDLLEGGKSLFAMRLQKVDGGRLLFGINDAAEDLVPGSPFLTRLDRFSRPKGVRYHVAVGRKGFLTAQQQREAVDDLDRILRDRGVSPFLRPAILRFAGAPELQTGRGDGVVTLESALLPGSETSHTFDLDHSELINPRVEPLENGEVFRWIVDTLKWRQHDGK